MAGFPAGAWNILWLQSPPQLIHSLVRCLDMYGSVGNYWLKSKKTRKHEHQEISMKSKSVVDELPAFPVSFMDLPFRQTFSGQPQCLQKATNSIQHIPQNHRVETTPAPFCAYFLCLWMKRMTAYCWKQRQGGRAGGVFQPAATLTQRRWISFNFNPLVAYLGNGALPMHIAH